jgi:hypothetical protein
MKNNTDKIMKLSPTIKTVIVKLTADNVSEFDIDTDVFEDPFMEAATRAVEKTKSKKHGIIRSMIDCWDKKLPKTPYMYNSYWVLVNAACYTKAELLRDKFRSQYDIDLSKEPLHGRKKS